jgi:hypothetical protein
MIALNAYYDSGRIPQDHPVAGLLEREELSAETARVLLDQLNFGTPIHNLTTYNITGSFLATSRQWGKITALYAELRLTSKESRRECLRRCGITDATDMTRSEASRLISYLESLEDAV